MKCNCLNKVLEQICDKVKPNEEILDFKANWKGTVLRFDGGCGVGLYVESEYRRIKKNGEPYSKMTHNENFVAMSFCPFCGKSLKKEGE